MNFHECKNILIIRPDNMGDLLMSVPAIRAVKNTFDCRVTVLCSSQGLAVVNLIEEIDDAICFDLPWLKFTSPGLFDVNDLSELIVKLKKRNFDGCILFNVYSQNPGASILLAYLADIKLRAAYCRENLYGLLTHWFPDDEPLSTIRHQVERDLNLVRFLGAQVVDDEMRILTGEKSEELKLLKTYMLKSEEYIILHTGVSEEKRQYPKEYWRSIAEKISENYQIPIILTGSRKDRIFTKGLSKEIGTGTINLAGKTDLKALAMIIKHAKCMISINTGPMHLAVALKTPLIALYAQSNPQHKPFKTRHGVLEYSVPKQFKSTNQIICFVNEAYYEKFICYPSPEQVMVELHNLI